jgi:hypothetical protein
MPRLRPEIVRRSEGSHVPGADVAFAASSRIPRDEQLRQDRPVQSLWEGIMKLSRRRFLHMAAGVAALPAISGRAWAQAYPTRPVRLIGLPAWRRG